MLRNRETADCTQRKPRTPAARVQRRTWANSFSVAARVAVNIVTVPDYEGVCSVAKQGNRQGPCRNPHDVCAKPLLRCWGWLNRKCRDCSDALDVTFLVGKFSCLHCDSLLPAASWRSVLSASLLRFRSHISHGTAPHLLAASYAARLCHRVLLPSNLVCRGRVWASRGASAHPATHGSAGVMTGTSLCGGKGSASGESSS